MSSRNRASRKSRHILWFALLGLITVAVIGAGVYVAYLDHTVRGQFEGKRWALPAYVYARPLELFPGAPLSADQLEQELRLLDYRPASGPLRAGTYLRRDGRIQLMTRPFTYWDGAEAAKALDLQFDGRVLTAMSGMSGAAAPDLARLDPVVIGRIYPAHHEDRILVTLAQVPPLLRDGLIAVEDRHFYTHWGIAPLAVARAMWANMREGEVVQGGSTLTQQLVKNFYLSNERTLGRKVNEALMAVLLDAHYPKNDILQAYCNEIYLGQDGRRAIHGFGLASQFYFGEDLQDLEPHQIALLIGIVKGPSYYDPRRQPQRMLARRNLVIDVMAARRLVRRQQAARAQATARRHRAAAQREQLSRLHGFGAPPAQQRLSGRRSAQRRPAHFHHARSAAAIRRRAGGEPAPQHVGKTARPARRHAGRRGGGHQYRQRRSAGRGGRPRSTLRRLQPRVVNPAPTRHRTRDLTLSRHAARRHEPLAVRSDADVPDARQQRVLYAAARHSRSGEHRWQTFAALPARDQPGGGRQSGVSAHRW